MDYTYCMSSLGAASAAIPALFEDVSAHRAPHRRNIAAPNKSSPTVSFDLPKGTWFDETISLLDPYGDTLTKQALSLIAKSECRKRKRRPIDEANLYTIVRSILANGLRCHHFRKPSRVAYFRKADGYVGKPAWLSGKAMSRAVDALSSAGLVKTTQGERGSSSTYALKGTDKRGEEALILLVSLILFGVGSTPLNEAPALAPALVGVGNALGFRPAIACLMSATVLGAAVATETSSIPVIIVPAGIIFGIGFIPSALVL